MKNELVVTTTLNKLEGTIIQETYCETIELRERITRELMDTREEQIRRALIELGWTPPPSTLDNAVSFCDTEAVLSTRS